MAPINLSSNWGLIWHQLYQGGVMAGTGVHTPIPTITPPILFTSPILAVTIENPLARQWWRLGGYVSMRTKVPGSDFEDLVILRTFCPVNSPPTFLSLPVVVNDFELTIDVPHWHEEVTVDIWEYTGPNPGPVVYGAIQ